MSDFRKQFNKGVLELVILKLLVEYDHYGYSLIQEINVRSGHVMELKDGTLYPILYRLEDQHFIVSYWKTQDGRGKPRKYYRITKSGSRRYEEMLVDYVDISQGVAKIIGK